ncbi:MAG: hypothetical protein ACLGI7_02790 [Gammaproteobacteria bacterium]
MQTAILVILAALAAALCVLLYRSVQQRRMLDSLEQDQRALTAAWGCLPAEAAQLLLPQTPALISIEILNPIELAGRESSLAAPVGALAPGLIRRIVYQRVASILREQLAGQGVEAEVRFHGLD